MSGGFGRKKACRFCTENDYQMDYKNVRILGSLLSEHGRIVPRRITGNCAHHQRQATTALKRARQLALLGYVSAGQ
ncbi:MAG: 30S ribosomal protein S18 [Bdellovibrionales bacterium]|nr:30S ribosomal protein S18 [Bdellovibrionales bacterium]